MNGILGHGLFQRPLQLYQDNDVHVSIKGSMPSLTSFLSMTPAMIHLILPKDVNRDEQNRRFCWPTSQLILMLGILIGGRFWDFKCLIWNFLIWKQQNLHIKENDQHLVQLLPNKLVTPFITVLLVSINVFGLFIFAHKSSFCREVTHFRPQDNKDEIVAQNLLGYLVL